MEERLRFRLTRKRRRSRCSSRQETVWALNQGGGRTALTRVRMRHRRIFCRLIRGGFPAFFHQTRRSCAKIFGSDRFRIDPPLAEGSPDLSRPKFTSQERTQKTTKASSSLLLPAIVHVGAPNAADLLPHHTPGATGESPDADRALRSFVWTFLNRLQKLVWLQSMK